MIQAAFSTVSLPNALGGAMDKLLGVVFDEARATWRSYAAVRPLDNFRQHTLISPQHRGELEELGADGKIKHGRITEDTSTLQIDTYAEMVTITRQAVVNDDLSILDAVGGVLARKALRKLNDLVYTVLMANAGNHFHVDNKNLLTGAGSALDATSLGSAVTAMRKQKDVDNNDLDIAPKVLLVPPELETTSLALLRSIEVNQTGDNSPTGNALKDIAALEVESRLSNSDKFSNASLTAWYLFAGPSSAPVYVGFLGGKQYPTVEYFGLDHDPKTLGLGWRVYHDFGAALGEHRAAVKSDGA